MRFPEQHPREVVLLDERGWMCTHDFEERTRRRAEVQALIAEIASPSQVEVRPESSSWKDYNYRKVCSIARSLRYLWVHPSMWGPASVLTITGIESMWDPEHDNPGPMLRLYTPRFEVDLGHTVYGMDGPAWLLRRSSF